MIKVKHVSKQWPDGHMALQDVSFEAQLGTVTAFIGRSGAGKSTLLRLLATLERPDRGEILSDHGQPGMVFQAPSLWPHLSLLQNVSLPLRLVKNLPQKEAELKAAEILTEWRLVHRLNAVPAELSGGEQQRGAIARALVLAPTVLCLDEITSALDPETSSEILYSVLNYRNDRTIILIATHHIGFARAAADQVVLLDEGRVIEVGSSEAVLESPQTARGRAFLSAALIR